MTARQPHPQEYIITMGRIIKARNMLMVDGYHNADVLDRMVNLLRARPHTSQPVPDSATLVQMAKTEWHNREERFGLHDEIPWTTGWMAGYLTPNKPDWSKEHDITIRKAEREKALKAVIEHCQKGIFNMNQCVVNNPKGEPIDEVHTQRADERRETYKDIIRLSESLRGGEQE